MLKIVVSQQGKKLSVKFFQGKVVDKHLVDKAEDFLTVVDKFLKKSKISQIRSINRIGQIRYIEFVNTGILTERVIRSIMLGLRFSISKLAQN